MNQYSYSVVIPCKDGDPAQVRPMLDSLLHAKKDRAVQILLVLSGESEKIEHLLKASKYSSIQVIPTGKGKVGAARNTGFQYVQAPYVLFFDSDDKVSADLFEQLDKKTAGSPDLIQFGFYKDPADQKKAHAETILPDPSASLEQSIFFAPGGGPCWNKCYSVKMLQEHHLLFDSTLSLGEDIEFNGRVLPHVGKRAVIEAPLYHYILHPQSASQRYRKDGCRQYLRTSMRINENPDISRAAKKRIALEHLIFSVVKYVYHPENGDKKKQNADLKDLLSQPVYAQIFKGAEDLKLSPGRKILAKAISMQAAPLLRAASKVYARRSS